MKRYIFALLTSAVLMLAACQEEIEFKGEEQDPQLVMYCLASAGEPLTVSISNSLFFLDDHRRSGFTAHVDTAAGSVKVYVNGSSAPLRAVPELSEQQDRFIYRTDYVPQAGDRINVTASFPGLGEATGGTVVPQIKGFTIKKSSVSELGDGRYRVHVNAVISDWGGQPLWYGLFPGVIMELPDYRMEEPLPLTSCDLIVQSATDELISGLIGGGSDAEGYFSNRSFIGSDREFNFTFDVYSDWEGREFNLRVEAISEDLYFHILSREAAGDELTEYFGEPGALHSNVNGAWGVVCSSASTTVRIELQMQRV